MTTRLARFTEKARAEPRTRFNALMGLVFDPAGLHASFERQAGRKAPGVDGIRKVDYALDVGAKITALSRRLRCMGYRPQPARRVYVPKGDGRYRPLGVPCFEDRLVQDRMSRLLQAIWEPEFRDCSYGFRPGRSAHDALRRVAQVVTYEDTQWVVEADVKRFFERVSHEHLMRFLAHRITDPRLLRIIRRFLKAGIMEDGAMSESEAGTPQGGLVSPVLSNIYLHYVLDLWFEKRFAKTCQGKAHLVRYADDFLACFQYQADAERFLAALEVRLAAFDLEVEPSKTTLLRFGSNAARSCGRDGLRRPKTFSFLGFTHFATRSRRGYFALGRRTEGKRLRQKLKWLNQRLRSLRVKGGQAMTAYVQSHLRGHIQYYGVSRNLPQVRNYILKACYLLWKWLNRRSQRRSILWWRFARLIPTLMPRPHVVHTLHPVPPWITQTGSRMV